MMGCGAAARAAAEKAIPPADKMFAATILLATLRSILRLTASGDFHID